MTSKLVRFLMAAAFVVSISAFAQTSSAAAPDDPSASLTSAPSASGAKLGTINIEQAIYATNEGQRDFEQLNTKMQPKQTELKKMSDELDGMKKQLSTQGDKLSEMARGDLTKGIEQKQKVFDREMQDARDDFQAQNNDVAQKILQKMAPIIMKYATDHGYGLIMDTSNPWPQGPVLWAGPTVDITKTVVDAYNAQSGVAAPAKPAASKPATSRPASTHPATHTGTAK
jgi:Skp family chaperone for outer membrane proteins